jgi:ectoine hydroxylase-related dioxygenase (phytanoyl-CoA dioxygenase family)
VVGILGSNIYLYHCHIDQNPPLDAPVAPVWAWHQDGGRQNVEIETEPTRPRFSVKVAYFLSDVSRPGRGNLKVVPGSHLLNRMPRSSDGSDPEGAIELCVPAGTAVIFDRRLWHSRSDNYSMITRKVLFVAYTYRWIRPRDDLDIDWSAEPYGTLDPARKQLLGWGPTALSFWSET